MVAKGLAAEMTVPRQRSSAWWRQRLLAYLFILPALIFVAVVFVYPIVRLIPMSLNRIAIGKSTWVGLSNFQYLIFQDRLVKQAVLNNLTLLLVGIPTLVVLSTILSALLYERVHGTGFYQAIVLLPYLMSVAVVGLVMRVFLRPQGALNVMLDSVGLGILAQSWLGSTKLAIWAVLGVIVWRELGMGVTFFLAELMTVDDEIFDAAKVDGASWFQQFMHITVPLLTTIISFYSIYLVMVFFSWTFAYVFVMTNGGPGFSTMVMEMTIYRYAVQKHMPHMASALSLILFLGMLTFVWAQFRIRRRLVKEE